MYFSTVQLAVTSSLVALVQGQGQLVSAVGDSGKSTGLQINLATTDDANIISTAEIKGNVVNQCGRTVQAGNIDVGANEEAALAGAGLTKVAQGSTVKVTINQVNATGAGPYSCDLDLKGNVDGATGQTKLTTKTGSADSNGQIQLTVTMPSDLACIGASTGDVCTVRCFNANEFGGCFGVQQTDTTPSVNTPANIDVASTADDISGQVAIDKEQVAVAEAAIADVGTTNEAKQGSAVAEALLAAFPVTTTGAAPAATGTNKRNDIFRAFPRRREFRQRFQAGQ